MLKETSYLNVNTVFRLAQVATVAGEERLGLILRFGGRSSTYLLLKRTKVTKGVWQRGRHETFKV